MKYCTFGLSLIFNFFSQIFISSVIFKDHAGIFAFTAEVDILKQAEEDYAALYHPTLSPTAKLTHIAQMMVNFKIIPTYIPLPPSKICNITYPYGVIIEPGIKVKARDVKDQPNVTWEYEEDKLYTLSMINIDRSLHKEAPWLVINIPGCDVTQGQIIRHHWPPHIVDGRNRHVFLVYEQKYRLNATCMETDDNIHYVFHMRSIAIKYNLGHPIAGNFFLLPTNNTGERDFLFGYEQYYLT